MFTLDFETEKIVEGTSPLPVGVAIKENDSPGKYLSWGHPIENNCTVEEAKKIISSVFENEHNEVVMHNAKFDIRVAMERLGVEIKAKIHDTMILSFLAYPYEAKLSLKHLASKYLGIPPQAQDDLREWLIENVREANEKNFGEYISLAPGSVVGRYAVMDVDMTYSLYSSLIKEVLKDEE